jgi:hypothetical protein
MPRIQSIGGSHRPSAKQKNDFPPSLLRSRNWSACAGVAQLDQRSTSMKGEAMPRTMMLGPGGDPCLYAAATRKGPLSITAFWTVLASRQLPWAAVRATTGPKPSFRRRTGLPYPSSRK